MDIRYNSLLGQGATGKAYRGKYAGADVAVKVVNISFDKDDLEPEIVMSM